MHWLLLAGRAQVIIHSTETRTARAPLSLLLYDVDSELVEGKNHADASCRMMSSDAPPQNSKRYTYSYDTPI